MVCCYWAGLQHFELLVHLYIFKILFGDAMCFCCMSDMDMHCIIRNGRPNKAQKSTKSEGSQTLIEECGPPYAER